MFDRRLLRRKKRKITPQDVSLLSGPNAFPVASQDLYTPFTSEFTGNWFYLKGDGSSQAGGQVLTEVGTPTDNTVSVMSGLLGGTFSGQYMGAGQQYRIPSFSEPTASFSLVWLGSLDAVAGYTAAKLIDLSNDGSSVAFTLDYVPSSVRFLVGKAGGTLTTVSAGSIMFSRVVHLVVATYEYVADGTSRMVLYVDGVQVGQSAVAVGPVVDSTHTLRISDNVAAATTYPVPGTIFGVGYTEKVLSPATVYAMTQSCLPDVIRDANGRRLYYARATVPASWVDSTTGKVGWSKPNKPRVINDGYFSEPAALNLIVQSDALATTPWTISSLTNAPTNNYDYAPDGSKTASRFRADAITGSGEERATQAVTLSNAATYTFSFWARAVSGTETLPYYVDKGVTNSSLQTAALTTTWQRFNYTFTTDGTACAVSIGNNYADTSTNSVAVVDALVCGIQLELGSTATSNIATTTAAVTRPVDDLRYYLEQTNYLRDTDDMTTARWTATNVTVTGGQTDSAGTTKAALVTATGTGPINHVLLTTTNSASTVGRKYVYECELRANAGRYVQFVRTGVRAGVMVDLQTGTIAEMGQNTSGNATRTLFNATISPKGNGWYRVSFVSQAEATNDTWAMYLSDTFTPPTPGEAVSFAQAGESVYAAFPGVTGLSSVDTDTLGDYLPSPVLTGVGTLDLTTGVSTKNIWPVNLCLQSEAMATSPWTKTENNATVTVTNDSADVPNPNNDTTGVSKLIYSVVSLNQYVYARQAITVAAGQIYTVSVWLRTGSGTFTAYALSSANVSYWKQLDVTSTWQRFSWQQARGSTSSEIRLGFDARGGYPQSPGGTVYAYGWQFEKGGDATIYAKTTTAAMSAMANKGEAKGDVKPIVSSAGGRVIGYSSGGTFTPLQLGTATYSQYFGGVSVASAAVSALAGRWSTGLSRWDQIANTMIVYADGQAGTPSVPGGLVYPVDFMTLGSGGGIAVNGYLRNVKVTRKS